jgi:hypothetical protein
MTSSSPQDESDYTLAQQVAITLVPAFSGTLSFLGSSCIIWLLLKDNRKKLKSVKHRILFALCFTDLINSLVFVFWSLPVPKDTPAVYGVPWETKRLAMPRQSLFILGILGASTIPLWLCTSTSHCAIV